MSNSTDERLRELERRVAALEEAGGDGDGSLRRALTGLRRQHRDLKERVEDDVMAVLDEEAELLSGLRTRVKEYGELMREIKKDRERIDDIEEELPDKVDRDEFEQALERLEAAEKRLMDRLRKVESRLDFLSDAIDE